MIFTRVAPDNRNERLEAQVNNAIAAIDNGFKVRVRVVRLSPQQAPQSAKNIIAQLVYGSISETKIISGKDLISSFLKLETAPINYSWPIDVKIENARPAETQTIVLKNPIGNDDIESLFCRLSLKRLVDLYYSQTPNDIIFESNVRSLQNDRKIKAEMLDSLSTPVQSRNFHKLHNGITIVCDSISSVSETRFIIENPQIVNGCQTVTNLSLEFRDDRSSDKLTNGSVLCKIFHATNREVERICLASNSQVSIKPWDLRTNDAIQKQIESYLQLAGIRYNRKAKNRGSNDLTFVELGQWLYAAMHGRPMLAKNNKRSIFDASKNSTYHTIFHENLDLPEVLSIVRDGIYIRNKIRLLQNEFEKQADLHFLIGFYLLRNTTWQPNTKFNRIKSRIRETISHMREIHDAEMKFDTMFAKKAETWQDLEPRIRRLI